MIWVDAHLSPAIAKWIAAELGHPAPSVRDLGLRNAKDKDEFGLGSAGPQASYSRSCRCRAGVGSHY
jgi:hypothetical protein